MLEDGRGWEPLGELAVVAGAALTLALVDGLYWPPKAAAATAFLLADGPAGLWA